MKTLTLALIGSGSVFFGCDSAQAPDKVLQDSSPARLSVTIDGETFKGRNAAAVSVQFTDDEDEGAAELSWGLDEGSSRQASLVVQTPYVEIEGGKLEMDLTGPTTAETAAYLFLDGETIADGHLSVKIAGGRATGAISTDEGIEITFDGVLSLSCAVPPASLGGGVTGSDGILIGDEAFATPACKKVKAALNP
jgi:hypothetical protein